MSLKGIDIASYQKSMDISKVDADFVIIKLTQGDYYVNPDFNRQYNEARSSGKLIGLYHYSNGVKPVSTEVDFLIKAAKPYLGTAIVCLDWETNGATKKSGLNPVFNTFDEPDYVYDFVRQFHEKTGIWPVIYMSASVTRRRDWSKVAKNCPLWVAQYKNDSLTGYQENPWRDNKGTGAWREIAIHQYSPSGTIKGYEQTQTHKLDMDIAYITSSEWAAYATGNGAKQKQYKKTTPEVVRDVLANKYGKNDERKAKLDNEGYDYVDVQRKINQILQYASDLQNTKKLAGEYWDLVLSRVV